MQENYIYELRSNKCFGYLTTECCYHNIIITVSKQYYQNARDTL